MLFLLMAATLVIGAISYNPPGAGLAFNFFCFTLVFFWLVVRTAISQFNFPKRQLEFFPRLFGHRVATVTELPQKQFLLKKAAT